MNQALRKDISVYNESLLFVITSKNLSGRDCCQPPGGDEWNSLVREGIFLPVMLVGDKAINLRVVVNDDLTPAERGEAAAHFASCLRVGDGRLAFLGGSEYLDGDDVDKAMEMVKLPRADYRADVFTCFAGVNGPYLTEFEDKELGERLGAWFRRTRHDADFPCWLADHCRAHPTSDPGYEDLWRSRGAPAAEPPEYLDFIVRLTPWNDSTAAEPPELDENGCIVSTPIVPTLCPMGIALGS